MIAFFFALLFKCGTNFSQLWGDYSGLRACALGHLIWIDEALAISDCAFDVITILLPLPWVWRPQSTNKSVYTNRAFQIWTLRLEWKRRLLVSLVFVIGALYVSHCAPIQAVFVD
jgi:hypothetical protein